MLLRTTGLVLALATTPLLSASRQAAADLNLPRGYSAPTPMHHVTLYQGDFLRHTVSLHTGEYGTIVANHQVFNVDSELDFGAYFPDGLSVGVQGGQVGDFYDLGTTAQMAARYGYSETVGGGQGFSSIHFQKGVLMILQDLGGPIYQPFTEGNQFLGSPPPVGLNSVPVQDGHIYLVRILDRINPQFFRFAKVMVTSHRPGDTVTLVWQELVP